MLHIKRPSNPYLGCLRKMPYPHEYYVGRFRAVGNTWIMIQSVGKGLWDDRKKVGGQSGFDLYRPKSFGNFEGRKL